MHSESMTLQGNKLGNTSVHFGRYMNTQLTQDMPIADRVCVYVCLMSVCVCGKQYYRDDDIVEQHAIISCFWYGVPVNT